MRVVWASLIASAAANNTASVDRIGSSVCEPSCFAVCSAAARIRR